MGSEGMGVWHECLLGRGQGVLQELQLRCQGLFGFYPVQVSPRVLCSTAISRLQDGSPSHFMNKDTFKVQIAICVMG